MIPNAVRHLAKWPLTAGVFAAQLLHHTAAFFAWAWLALHVIFPVASAGFGLGKIWTEATRYLSDGTLHWRGLLAAALVPAVLVATRQSYVSIRELRRRHGHDHHTEFISNLSGWPAIVARFVVSLAHHTAAFFAWMWLLFALIGSIGQIGFHLTAMGQFALDYFKSRSADRWQWLLAASVAPALFVAVWSARNSYRGLLAWARGHHHGASARQVS